MLPSVTVSLQMSAIGGAFLFVLLVLEVLVGLRKIRFGKHHLTWHRRLGFALVVLGAIHGLTGLALVFS